MLRKILQLILGYTPAKKYKMSESIKKVKSLKNTFLYVMIFDQEPDNKIVKFGISKMRKFNRLRTLESVFDKRVNRELSYVIEAPNPESIINLEQYLKKKRKLILNDFSNWINPVDGLGGYSEVLPLEAIYDLERHISEYLSANSFPYIKFRNISLKFKINYRYYYTSKAFKHNGFYEY